MSRLRLFLAALGAASILGFGVAAHAQGLSPSFGTVPSIPTTPSLGQAGEAAAAAQSAVQGDNAESAPADKKAVVKKKRKIKPKAPKELKAGVGQVLVVNSRSATLVSLTLTAASGKSAIVSKGLAAGGRALGKLPAKGGCNYSATGEFDDGTSLAIDSVEVCKDRTLNLVD